MLYNRQQNINNLQKSKQMIPRNLASIHLVGEG